MTLILAVRCAEGVVLASDGQATSDAAGQPTRSPVRKLFDIGGHIAWGAAGSVGLQQTLRAELSHLSGLPDEPHALRRRLASIVLPIQQRAVRDFVPQPGTDPPDLACVFAWHDGDSPYVLSIPRTGSEHQFHHSHAAIGTGDIFADFAMASVAHLRVRSLGLEISQLVAHKTISDAIAVAAVYLGPPVQLYLVDRDGAHRVPRAVVEGEVARSVEAWEGRQRAALDLSIAKGGRGRALPLIRDVPPLASPVPRAARRALPRAG